MGMRGAGRRRGRKRVSTRLGNDPGEMLQQRHGREKQNRGRKEYPKGVWESRKGEVRGGKRAQQRRVDSNFPSFPSDLVQ